VHKTYRDLLLSRIDGAVTTASAASQVRHKGIKGQLREIVIRELLRPLLPPDIGVGTGEIVALPDESSHQQDIVIYDKSLLPAFLLERTLGVFPVECVLHVIEVKSRLDAKEVRKSHEAAKKLDRFKYTVGIPTQQSIFRTVNPLLLEKLRYLIFAFSSDLKRKSELARYKEISGDMCPPLVRGICVVNRGAWLWSPSPGTNHYDWIAQAPDSYTEVLAFLSYMVNEIPLLRGARYMPQLGYYLL